ncbi:MAG: hypothetical protein JW757_03620 [Anaerolineales bacterium]|nr:hypothetical protein [Anaerolineales bacterium]
MKGTKPERGDYLRSIAYILFYVLIIGVGAVLLLPRHWYLWAVIVMAGLIWLVNWHRTQTLYQCPNCGHIYQISFWTDLISPHGVDKDGGWLSLHCPNCKQRRKTRVLKRANSNQ